MPSETLPFERLGEYRLVREVGRGAMGVVYEAVHEPLRRRVALKVLPAEACAEPENVLRFKREAEAAASISHPHLVTVHDVGEDRGRHYLAMEFLDGETLAQRIRRQGSAGLPVEEVLAIGRQVAAALAAAHAAGVIHRDIKPSNLMVLAPAPRDASTSPSAETVVLGVDLRVKVTDFGLARPISAATLTATGALVGTPMYMAPEQVDGLPLDGRADVYGLGMALYEAAAGCPPFFAGEAIQVFQKVLHEEPVPPRRLRPSLPRDLETVILKAIEKERDRRYSTATELEEDLGRIASGQPVLARPVGVAGRLARRVARHPVVSAVVIGALVVGAAVAGVGLWRSSQESEAARRKARAGDLLAEADRDVAAGRGAQAIAKLYESAELEPSRGETWRALAELLRGERRIEEAARAARRATDLSLLDPEAWLTLGRVELARGDPESARRAAEEAIRLAPASIEAWRLRADVRGRQGDAAGSLEDLRKAEALDAEVDAGRLSSADDALAEDRALDAIRLVSSMSEARQATPEAALRTGLALERLAEGVDEGVLHKLDELGIHVQAAGPTFREALRARAEEELGRAAGLADPRAASARARLARARGDLDAVLSIWSEVLDRSPDDVAALRRRVEVLAESGEWNRLGEDVEHLLRLDEKDPFARFWRGAAVPLQQASIGVRSAWPRLAFAVFAVDDELSSARGEFAIEDLDAAIAAGHEPRMGRLLKAGILQMTRRQGQALAEVEALLSEDGDDPLVLSCKALILVRSGDAAGAKTLAERALARDERSIAAWGALSDAARALGDVQTSGRAVDRMLTLYGEAEAKTPSTTSSAARSSYGITLEDLKGGFARFGGRDLGPFVEALGSADERVRAAAEAAIWEAGPAALADLSRAEAPAARDLANRIEAVVRAEEEGLLRSESRKHFQYAVADEAAKSQAVADAVRACGERARAALLRGAHSELEAVARDSMALLGAAWRSEAEGTFLSLLGDPDPKVANRVFRYAPISWSMDPATLPPHVLALTELEDLGVRRTAIGRLAAVLDRKIEGAALRGLREDPDHATQWAEALVAMDSLDSVPSLLAALEGAKEPWNRCSLVRAAAALGGPGVVEALRRIAATEGGTAHVEALRGLGERGDEGDVTLLVAALGSEDPGVAASAAAALGQIGALEGIQALRNRMEAGGELGEAAALSLASMGERDALAWLRPRLTGEPSALLAGAAALGAAGDDVAAPFATLLGTDAPEAWRASILDRLGECREEMEGRRLAFAFGEMGDARAVAALEALRSGEASSSTRVVAAWALGRCGRVVEEPAARAELRTRTGLLFAAEVLARAGDAEARAYLRQVLAGEVRFRAWDAAAERLSRPPSLRLQAARALAACGERDGVLALVELLGSRDVLERRRALAALRASTGKDAEYTPFATRPELEKGRQAWEDAVRE